MILPDTDEGEAAGVAERMRAAIEDAAMPIADGFHVTISLGVAGLAPLSAHDPRRWDDVLRRADDAMYRAKAAGRNRVVAASA